MRAGFSVEVDVQVGVGDLIRPTRVSIVADRGVLSPEIVSTVSFHLYSLTEEILVAWRAATDHGGGASAQRRARQAIRGSMIRRQRPTETRREYVHWLWVREFEPSGRSQTDLANYLGRGLDVVRKYVSEQGREGGKK
jgi:hypothetical protein